jgi:AraC family transcriptional regulator of adaptative response/methylated-DNA-[protein]-cysteine methyltransferase
MLAAAMNKESITKFADCELVLDFEAVQRELATPRNRSSSETKRVFQRWANTDVASFMAALTKEHARKKLRQSAEGPGVAGASDPDLDISCELIKSGKGFSGIVRHGTYPTPFGQALIALSERGVCSLQFGGKITDLQSVWREAEFTVDSIAVGEIGERIFSGSTEPIPVHLRGSEFQISVWLALLSLPMGRLTSYQAIARSLGNPGATRAVGSAIARNQIGYIVPCHRVIRGSGTLGEYRWGTLRKQAMIGWEAAKAL